MTNTNTAPQEAHQEQVQPCPFCGSQPQLVRLGTGNGFSYSYHCPNTDCLATNGKFDAWVSAIIAWNRRTREDELRAELTRVLEVAIARGEQLDYSDDDYRARYLELTGRDYDTEATDGQ